MSEKKLYIGAGYWDTLALWLLLPSAVYRLQVESLQCRNQGYALLSFDP